VLVGGAKLQLERAFGPERRVLAIECLSPLTLVLATQISFLDGERLVDVLFDGRGQGEEVDVCVGAKDGAQIQVCC
jgi:hypothetical protein